MKSIEDRIETIEKILYTYVKTFPVIHTIIAKENPDIIEFYKKANDYIKLLKTKDNNNEK